MEQKTENTEVAVIKAEDFGLSKVQSETITEGLQTILDERKILTESYKLVIVAELNDETIEQAKKLKLKIRDNRTKGLEKWHEGQKAYWLAGGKFVDATRRVHVIENERMEAALDEIVRHHEIKEKKRLDKVETARKELLAGFPDLNPAYLDNVRDMTDDMFANFYKEQNELKAFRELKAKEAAEAQKLIDEKAALETKRRSETVKIANFIDDYDTLVFADLKELDFVNLVRLAFKKQADEKARLAKAEAENERLKKEADEKAAADKKAAAEKAAITTARNQELRPYIVFIRDYPAMLEMEEAAYQKEFAEIKKGAELQWEEDREQLRNKAIEDQAREEAMQKEAEIKAKAAAEKAATEKAEADKAKAEADALAMDDEQKWDNFLNDMKAVFVLHEFKSEVYQKRVKLIKNTLSVITATPVDQKLNININ